MHKLCLSVCRLEESVLHRAIMTAIMGQAKKNTEVLKALKLHIGMGIEADSVEDKSLDIQVRIAEIDTEFKRTLGAISAENAESFNEVRMTELMYEKQNLQQQLSQIAGREQKRKNAKSRLDEIFTILDGLENHPMEYDDSLVRQLMECIVVENKEKIKIVFVGGLEVEQTLE